MVISFIIYLLISRANFFFLDKYMLSSYNVPHTMLGQWGYNSRENTNHEPSQSLWYNGYGTTLT